MARPSNEAKRQAAQAQVDALRAEGYTDETIKAKLLETGLTMAQVATLFPKPEVELTETPKPVVGIETKNRMLDEASQFLEYAHRKLQNCRPEHAGIRNDMLVWARRLKGAL